MELGSDFYVGLACGVSLGFVVFSVVSLLLLGV